MKDRSKPRCADAIGRRMRLALAVALVLALPAAAHSQVSHWASATDATAKALIELERKWAEAGCTNNGIEKTILAEDFQGTEPDGTLYSKKEAILPTPPDKIEHDCKMFEVKVHFLGENMAILYGSESALRPVPGAKPAVRKLIWTDTWLKRGGTWQIVAAMDMVAPAK